MSQVQTPAAKAPKAEAPAVVKPAGQSTETIVSTFAGLAGVSRKALALALKSGVNASGIMAVTAYKITMFGGTKAQAHFALFETEKPAKTDSGEAKMWRAAWALAGYWRFNKALPETISGANSDETAFIAATEWLEANKLSSLVALEAFVERKEGDGEEAAPKAKVALPLRLARTVQKAKKSRDFSVVDARQTGAGLVAAMGFANATAFVESATKALAEMAQKRADAASKALAAEAAKAAKTGTNG